jgi:hypothetical protein
MQQVFSQQFDRLLIGGEIEKHQLEALVPDYLSCEHYAALLRELFGFAGTLVLRMQSAAQHTASSAEVYEELVPESVRDLQVSLPHSEAVPLPGQPPQTAPEKQREGREDAEGSEEGEVKMGRVPDHMLIKTVRASIFPLCPSPPPGSLSSYLHV